METSERQNPKVICGDAFSEIKKIPSSSVHFVLTDPPYVISRDTNFSKGGGNEAKYGKLTMDFGEWDNGDVDVCNLLPEIKRVLAPGGTAVIFYDIFKIGRLWDAAESLGFKQPRVGFWRKTNPVPINAHTNYLSNAREYFLSVTKGSKRTFNDYYNAAEFSYPIVSGKQRIHPTQKPVELMRDIIEQNTLPGDIVLDPFFGSGSVGKAALSIGRKFIGIEINQDYYKRFCESEMIDNIA